MPSPVSFAVPLEGADGSLEVQVTRRRRSGVVIRAYPDGHVTLSVPTWFTKAQAEEFVASHRDRILAQAASVEPSSEERRLREAIRRLAEGDRVPVWGRDATVIYRDAASRAQARLERGAVVLALPPAAQRDGADARAVRLRAYETLLRRELDGALPDVIDLCERSLDVRTGQWTVRKMRSRWGSCRWQTGSISINLDLATHAPEHLRNVSLHETCHMLAHDHGPAFKALMDRVSPQWRELDRKLEAEGVRLP